MAGIPERKRKKNQDGVRSPYKTFSTIQGVLLENPKRNRQVLNHETNLLFVYCKVSIDTLHFFFS